MNHAVIDIGTNTLILLIARVKGKKKFEVLHDEAVITRLGQGLTENHYFLPESMNRTREVLRRFKQRCVDLRVKRIVAVGTAACRTAANAEIFVDAVKKDTGINIHIISADQEAEYTFLATLKEFWDKKNPLIVVDIGGGSTEIITGPLEKKRKWGPETIISLALGTVRLTELYVKSDPIEEEQLKKLHIAIRNGITDDLDDFYPKTFRASAHRMIATAGTATTLSALDKKVKTYNPEKIHGKPLKKTNLEEIIKQLIPMAVKDRQRLPGMEPNRADVILTGAIILNELMKFFDQNQVIVSDHGLRYGVFYKKLLK